MAAPKKSNEEIIRMVHNLSQYLEPCTLTVYPDSAAFPQFGRRLEIEINDGIRSVTQSIANSNEPPQPVPFQHLCPNDW